MKRIALILLPVIALAIAACNNEDDITVSCGEMVVGSTSISTINGFNQFNLAHGVPDGNSTYYTAYATAGGRSTISLKLWLRKICRIDDAQLVANLEFTAPPAGLTDSLIMYRTDQQTPPTGIAVPADAPGMFSKSHTLDLGPGYDGTEVVAINRASFPSQGSWSADSTYFFTNLTKQSIAIHCNTIK